MDENRPPRLAVKVEADRGEGAVELDRQMLDVYRLSSGEVDIMSLARISCQTWSGRQGLGHSGLLFQTERIVALHGAEVEAMLRSLSICASRGDGMSNGADDAVAAGRLGLLT